ncbi:MAG: hypothetical protein JWM10_3057 [Myxococcaceae bacterium]|nr:hypothetical protein [Myxococcaceae bacterium]
MEECDAAGTGECVDLREECRRQIDERDLRGANLEDDAGAREVGTATRRDEAETADLPSVDRDVDDVTTACFEEKQAGVPTGRMGFKHTVGGDGAGRASTRAGRR